MDYLRITLLWSVFLLVLHFVGVSVSLYIEPRISHKFKYPKYSQTYGSEYNPRHPQIRWDSFWYINIAREGYSIVSQFKDQKNIAFFPLYPLFIRGFHKAFKIIPMWM